MPDFTNFRFNETLMGRIQIGKMRGTAVMSETHNENVKLRSTVLPDVKFDSISDWLDQIRRDSRLLEQENQRREETAATMDQNLLYMHDWLGKKFNTIY
jgi:hypothetical protein